MLTIKQILRNLWRSRFLNAVNLLGIVIGLTTCILLLLYVKTQYQADKCFPDYENIYQINSNWGSSISEKYIKLFKENVAEVKEMTLYQYSWSWQDIIYYNETNYKIDDVVYADSSFFEVFQFKTLNGNANEALKQAFGMVITKKEALRIFGSTDIVGQSFPFKTSDFGTHEYTIKAIIDDIPENSSIHFQAVLPLASLMKIDWYKNNADHWGTCNYRGFVLLHKYANPKQVAQKFDSLCLSTVPEWAQDIAPFYLNGLKGLHFDLQSNDGVFATSNQTLVNLLAAIGILILLLAGINYFNLNLSQLEQNNTRIGISKVVGASKFNIAFQSILSTLIIYFLGLIITTFVIITILPLFNEITGSSFNFHSFFNPSNLQVFIAFILISGLIFGIFPALISSKLKPLSMLNKKKIFSQKQPVMQVLVVFQFTLSIALIASTILIYKQNKYLLTANYGFDAEQIMYIPISPDLDNKLDVLEHEIEQLASVAGVAMSSEVFGNVEQNWGRNMYGDGETKDIEIANVWVSADFMQLFNIDLIKGRAFDEQSAEKREMIYNEAFIKKYNIKNPLQTSLNSDFKKYNTVGVIRNFNFGTLHDPITPFAFICSNDGSLSTLFVKFNTLNNVQTQSLIADLGKIWNNYSPNFPFEYKFMNTHYHDVYENEIRMSKILTMASILSILLASLGLFCLSYFIIGKRIKEIGVRKVNGAKVTEILALLNVDFIRWITIAFIVAIPISWYAMNKWLATFAYKTTINWWIFLVAGLITLFIALFTVSWQSYRAARKNPVEALRYE